MGARHLPIRGLSWIAQRIPGGATLWSSWQRLLRREPVEADRSRRARRRRDLSRPARTRRHAVTRPPAILAEAAAGADRMAAVVCAWCETPLRNPGDAVATGPVSHGLCAACARRLPHSGERLK